VRIGSSEALTHLLFVDDVLLFYFGLEREGQCFKNILQICNKAIGMEINENKSTVYTVGLESVDHLFQLGVNVMYHEDMYLVVQQV
jgi:hypothetical protein